MSSQNLEWGICIAGKEKKEVEGEGRKKKELEGEGRG